MVLSSTIEHFCLAMDGVLKKGGYAWIQTQTQAILKCTFAFIQQFIFMPTAVYKSSPSNQGANLIPASIHL